jgi:integrase
MLKLLLNGAKNLDISKNNILCNRRVANIHTLKLLSHALASSDWQCISKQVVWSCCTLAFFASLRVGEILSCNVSTFDPTSTLLWKHIKFLNDDNILLYIPCSKTKKYAGEFVDIFPVKNSFCCAVKALKKLQQLQIELRIFDFDQPVFSFAKYNFLTTRKLNDLLKKLLSPWYDPCKDVISCHSFRGAIINIMQKNMSDFKPEDYRLCGRWDSDAYMYYLRNHRADRKLLFEKLSVLLSMENK